jgi:hypothetical protein
LGVRVMCQPVAKDRGFPQTETAELFARHLHVGGRSTGSVLGISTITFLKWQSIVGIAAAIFRSIGGPTLISTILRTPGAKRPVPCHH